MTFTSIENNFVIVLNQQAPKKSEVFRGNQKPHLNKSLRSAIMKCSRLKNVLNCYFDSVTDSLDLFPCSTQTEYKNTDALQNILKRFQNHASSIKIKQLVNKQAKFFFQPVSVYTVKDVIEGLPSNKTTAEEIPIKILKENGFTFEYLTSCVNEAILSGKFPDSLKLSNIVPVHKKKDPTDKCNYRPLSILSLLSNVFLNELLCGFCKAHSTQRALFKFLQAWQKELDNSGFIGTILLDLSKSHDCLPHNLLIAKLGGYGLDRSSLRLLMDYLNSCKQQKKLVNPTASGLTLNREFRKVPYWDPYYSTYL